MIPRSDLSMPTDYSEPYRQRKSRVAAQPGGRNPGVRLVLIWPGFAWVSADFERAKVELTA
jgi:hypothetical protein